MRGEEVVVGNVVRVATLHNTTGMLCGPKHLANRRAPVTGRIVSREQCGDDGGTVLVWVKHGKTTAPYWNYELDFLGEPTNEQSSRDS